MALQKILGGAALKILDLQYNHLFYMHFITICMHLFYGHVNRIWLRAFVHILSAQSLSALKDLSRALSVPDVESLLPAKIMVQTFQTTILHQPVTLP